MSLDSKGFWPVLHLHLNMMFYKPSIAQPGVLSRYMDGYGLKYMDH